MATKILTPSPRQQFIDEDGNPIVGGKVHTYVSGTTTPLATYTDATGNTANANPVILDSSGRASIWLTNAATYTFDVDDANDVDVYTEDGISAPINSSTMAAAGGSALVGFQQSGVGAITRTVQSKLRESPVSVLDYGAVGNGTTDDSGAIQAAVDAVNARGGAVYFPTQINGTNLVYKVTTQINIQSTCPIDLISNMTGYGQVSPFGSYISIGGNISGSVFKYSSPTGTRSDAGGGCVSGLAFRDPTGSGSAQGTRTLTACLELIDFNVSSVKDCSFHFILGSAIKTQFCVQSRLEGLHIRYCGTTAKPALWLASDSGAVYVTQACELSGNMEVCYDAAYIQEDRYSANNVFRFRFEADTAITTSNSLFFESSGSRTILDVCHFDRNLGVQFDFTANASLPMLVGCMSNTNGPTAQIDCNTVIISGFQQLGAYTGTQLKFVNGGATITGYRQRGGGSIDLGTNSMLVGGEVRNNVTTDAYAIVADDGSCVQAINIQGNATGGLKLIGTCSSSLGNTIHENGAIGLRNESPNGAIYGNRCYNNTGADMSFTEYPVAYDANGNFAFDETYPLKGTATYDPPSLNDGDVAVTSVSVAGAVGGDLVSVGFSQGQSGMIITGTVLAADTVQVVFYNRSGGIVNLPSGLITVTVRKALTA